MAIDLRLDLSQAAGIIIDGQRTRESGRQFDKQHTQRQREWGDEVGLRRDKLGESARQFDVLGEQAGAELALQRERLTGELANERTRVENDRVRAKAEARLSDARAGSIDTESNILASRETRAIESKNYALRQERLKGVWSVWTQEAARHPEGEEGVLRDDPEMVALLADAYNGDPKLGKMLAKKFGMTGDFSLAPHPTLVDRDEQDNPTRSAGLTVMGTDDDGNIKTATDGEGNPLLFDIRELPLMLRAQIPGAVDTSGYGREEFDKFLIDNNIPVGEDAVTFLTMASIESQTKEAQEDRGLFERIYTGAFRKDAPLPAQQEASIRRNAETQATRTVGNAKREASREGGRRAAEVQRTVDLGKEMGAAIGDIESGITGNERRSRVAESEVNVVQAEQKARTALTDIADGELRTIVNDMSLIMDGLVDDIGIDMGDVLAYQSHSLDGARQKMEEDVFTVLRHQSREFSEELGWGQPNYEKWNKGQREIAAQIIVADRQLGGERGTISRNRIRKLKDDYKIDASRGSTKRWMRSALTTVALPQTAHIIDMTSANRTK